MTKVSVNDILLKAKLHATRGENEEAIRLYEIVLKTFPKNKSAQRALFRLSKFSEKSSPESSLQDHVNELMVQYNQGNFKYVVTNAEKLVDNYPESLMLWNLVGAANRGLGRFDKAVNAFTKTTLLNPLYPDGFNNLGVTLKNQGKLDAALSALREALKLKPDYAEAHNNIGNVFSEKGDAYAAAEAYGKALIYNPKYTEARFNMGVSLLVSNAPENAILAFSEVLSERPDYADAHFYIGNAFKNLGKLQEAIEAYESALVYEPNYPEALNNLGVILFETNKFNEALVLFDRAIVLNSDYGEAYSNRGNVYKGQGRLDEAIKSYKKAISLKPYYIEAYINLGIIFNDQDCLEEALWAFKQALDIQPNHIEALFNISLAIKGRIFQKPFLGLQDIIISILKHGTLVRPSEISNAAISLVKLKPSVQKILKETNSEMTSKSVNDISYELSKVPLLLDIISLCPVADLELETFFKKMRTNFLLIGEHLKPSSQLLAVQKALALHCFTNEYIYDCTDKELKEVARLEALVANTLLSGKQPTYGAILCLASYRSLNEFDWLNQLVTTKEIKSVIKRQVIEPRHEHKLKLNITVLENISDKVSGKVREQYEQSPYPRWVNLGLPLSSGTIAGELNRAKIRLLDNKVAENDAPNILIAGCGTGQHSIGTAARFRNSEVLAVDLSSSSLAYAMRKTEELGINNIEYMQADILSLGTLNMQFDIVESVGVLHHMNKPMAGWKILTDCLKPRGLMRIGLYSEFARKEIVEIREKIIQSGINSSAIEMKSFRDYLINSKNNSFQIIKNFGDFYSLSELKDLLFHVQEHQFTIPKIKSCLESLSLQFCGFEDVKIVNKFSKNHYGEDEKYDLDKWNSYEENNSKTFGGMYQFWCQKIN